MLLLYHTKKQGISERDFLPFDLRQGEYWHFDAPTGYLYIICYHPKTIFIENLVRQSICYLEFPAPK